MTRAVRLVGLLAVAAIVALAAARPAEAQCSQYSGFCSSCVSALGCGYCEDNDACYTGSQAGPSFTVCSNWRYYSCYTSWYFPWWGYMTIAIVVFAIAVGAGFARWRYWRIRRAMYLNNAGLRTSLIVSTTARRGRTVRRTPAETTVTTTTATYGQPVGYSAAPPPPPTGAPTYGQPPVSNAYNYDAGYYGSAMPPSAPPPPPPPPPSGNPTAAPPSYGYNYGYNYGTGPSA